jgi:hypothetical protein
VLFVCQGDVVGDVDPAWTQDHGEIVQVAWLAAQDLSVATTRSLHWPALQPAGLA